MGLRNRIVFLGNRVNEILVKPFIVKTLFILISVLIVIALPVTISICSGLTFNQYVELIESLLVWPTAILIIGLYFLITYRDTVDQKIRDLVNAKVFNSELNFNQTPTPDPNLVEMYKTLYWEQKAMSEYLGQTQTQLIDEIRTLELTCEFNEFMYLNEFLVSTTKHVFIKISLQTITIEHYDFIFNYISLQQRRIIKDVLEGSGLISVYQPGNILVLTEKGIRFKAFLDWRSKTFGPLSIYPAFERSQLEAASTKE